MMVASAQVIGHRGFRMAAAGSNPGARDRAEFALMGQEKVDAVQESVQAMTSEAMDIGMTIAAEMVSNMIAAGQAGLDLAVSATPMQAARRQIAWVQALTAVSATAMDTSGNAARVTGRGLQPFHTRARANAKRLNRNS